MDTEAQNFTTWKFRWLDALLVAVEGKELRIALYLLQRCNAGSKQINPSMRNVAHMLNLEVRSVERATARLVTMGVVSRTRSRRQDSYRYEFVDGWLALTEEVERSLREEWQGKRLEKDPSKQSVRKTISTSLGAAEKAPRPDSSVVPDPTVLSG